MLFTCPFIVFRKKYAPSQNKYLWNCMQNIVTTQTTQILVSFKFLMNTFFELVSKLVTSSGDVVLVMG